MGLPGPVRGGVCRGVCSLALLCAAVSASASEPEIHPTRPLPATSAWEQAQKQRAAFEAQGPGTHNKLAYTRVLDAFRAIYHDNPRDPHAPDAVHAVAELLAEQGRELDDEKSLRAAVGQYEFLRTQYPGSPLRVPALLAEARLERDDLGDDDAAREKLQALLKEAPRSSSAAEARREMVEIAAPGVRGETATHAVTTSARQAKDSAPQARKAGSVLEAEAVPSEKVPAPGTTHGAVNTRDAGAATAIAAVDPASVNSDGSGAASRPEILPAKLKVEETKPVRTTLASVTGIRHWSTATYTRVAIDLGDDVKFEAARVPHPDRIYFDLHGAKLAQELVGKSFDVTDDGFLKRIRAAQSGPDVTRVVLDVNDVTEYSAFLLPNPYRLIIDIHGGKPQEKDRVQAPGIKDQETEIRGPRRRLSHRRRHCRRAWQPIAPACRRPRRPMAGTWCGQCMPRRRRSLRRRRGSRKASQVASGKPTPQPVVASRFASTPTVARPVPNAVAVPKPATTSEVAAVSDSPGRVEATSAPTSKPIVATVKASDRVRPNNEEAVTRPVRTPAGSAGAAPAKAAEKTADGETSLIRALGLKIGRIVIDAGHGGHDSGTLGARRHSGKGRGAGRRAAPGQAAARPAGRGDHLHPIRRHVYSARDAHRHRQQGAGRPVLVDSCQQFAGCVGARG